MVKFQFSTILKEKRPSPGEEVRGLTAQKLCDSWVGWSWSIIITIPGLLASQLPKLTEWQPPQLYNGQFSSGKRIPSLHKMLLAEDYRFHNTEEDTQKANQHMKRCSASLTIREMQNKSTMRWHYTAIRMPKNDTTKHLCGETESPIQCWGEHEMVQPLWKTIWHFL